jgi:hypothetical protein
MESVVRKIYKDALMDIYKDGYNKAIEDVTDYLFSYNRPKISNEHLAELNSHIIKMKKT